MSNTTIQFQIELPLTSEWRNVELLRSSVLNCLTTIFSNHDFCRTIGMVTGELLENALKFGDWTNRTEFRLKVFGTVDRVTIEVFNPVAPGDPGVEHLLSTIRWLEQMDDPKGAFLARLGELAQSTDEGESGIGLVRIAYEGDCTLAASVDNGIVRVCATTRP
jgi:hypothetical protein